jgi:hypothetical protein
MPIAGWKAMLLAVDEECGGHHTPWETDDVAYKTKAMAIEAAESWAEAEGLQFFDDCPNITEDAPDVSVKEQLVRIFGNDIGFVDLKSRLSGWRRIVVVKTVLVIHLKIWCKGNEDLCKTLSCTYTRNWPLRHS